MKLQPLSQLTGLRDLRLSTQHFFADATLDSISSIRQQLERLELQLLYGSSAKTAVTSAPAVLRRLSSLGSLQHLTHLLFTCTLKAADGPSASLPLHGLGDAAAIAGLTACKRLISLQLPWAKLTGGAAELLAAGLPCLMQLTVRQVQPMAPVAPCSWRELTLLGELQGLHDLIKLPLSGLDHLSLTHLVLAPYHDGGVEPHIHTLERYVPLLAAKLLGLSRLTLDCGWLHMDGAQLTSLLASIVTLGGTTLTDFAITGLPFTDFEITGLPVRRLLQRSHMEQLAMGLLCLTQLSLLHRNLALGDWSRLGTLAGLHSLFLDRRLERDCLADATHGAVGVLRDPPPPATGAAAVRHPGGEDGVGDAAGGAAQGRALHLTGSAGHMGG